MIVSVSFNKRIFVTSDVLFREVSGESVMLNVKDASYLGLDDVGTRIWTALTSSDSIQAAYEVLLAEYDVDADRLRQDLTDLVEKLLAHGLVEVVASSSSP